MPLVEFSCRDFRCLREAELSVDPAFTLVVGANASGKTSLLEAIAYLGRGRSFRNAPVDSVLRHGAREFLVRGVSLGAGGGRHRVGVSNGRDGLAVSIDGDRAGGLADLAALLPLQVVDPDVHQLVAGGPDQRRRFLDWVGFHVEPGFLARWRRYRRVLRQRNALLRAGNGGLEVWDREFMAAGGALDGARQRVVAVLQPALGSAAEDVLGCRVEFSYAPGWKEERSLEEAMAAGRQRDVQAGSCQVGPHRADLRLKVEQRAARRLVSRGQQKLLACGMILGSVEVVQAALGRQLLLLLDDPAAELDEQSMQRLMRKVSELECQVVATALHAGDQALPPQRALFHVEQGVLRRA